VPARAHERVEIVHQIVVDRHRHALHAGRPEVTAAMDRNFR
jgi:hypothetical protein